MVSTRDNRSRRSTHDDDKVEKHGSKERPKKVGKNYKTHIFYVLILLSVTREKKGTLVYITHFCS